MSRWTSIIAECEGGIARVTLNRPERRNAFDQRMVEELRAAFDDLADDRSVRGVILTGAGPVFCAGADLRWLTQDGRFSGEEAREDARLLAGMYRTIDEYPHPVIGRVQVPLADQRRWSTPGSSCSGSSRCAQLPCRDRVRIGFQDRRTEVESKGPVSMSQRCWSGSRPLKRDSSALKLSWTSPAVRTPKVMWVESSQ